ncbi:MAG: hypothetical protein GY804_05705 [Alphaproteobacteria bacterium]|nr:hypothetical protein [Alphaproteobacteria bacterium]
MFKRCFVILLLLLTVIVVTGRPAIAGGVPSQDSNMTQNVIRDVVSRYTQVFDKIEEIQNKVGVYEKLFGMSASLHGNFVNIACLDGASVGRINSGGAVLASTGRSSAGCSNSSGIGAPVLPMDTLWGDINDDGEIAQTEPLKEVLGDSSVLPIAVLGELTDLLITGDNISGSTMEEKQFNLRNTRRSMSKNATLTSLSNTYKIQRDVTKYKSSAAALTDDCARSAGTWSEAIACSTQGIGLNMLIEMERTKIYSSRGTSEGFANAVDAKMMIPADS